MLCASNEEHTAVDPINPPEGAAIGERVTFEGCAGPQLLGVGAAPAYYLLKTAFPSPGHTLACMACMRANPVRTVSLSALGAG